MAIASKSARKRYHLVILHDLLLLLVSILCFPRASSSVSFDYNFSAPGVLAGAVLKYTGNSTAAVDRIDLTKPTKSSNGRVAYGQPVRLWDNGTGQVASFTSNFTFVIKPINGTQATDQGDGMAFFVASYPGNNLPPQSGGGYLGLLSAPTPPFNSSPPIVAVEFDTHRNEWDPSDTWKNHIGVDVNSIRSAAYRALPNGSFNGTMSAWVRYDASARTLSATLRFDDHLPGLQGLYDVSTTVDLREARLPQDAAVGFSAATGGDTEHHQILSWSFESTLDSGITVINNNNAGPGTRGRPWVIAVSVVAPVIVLLAFCFIVNRRRLQRRHTKGKSRLCEKYMHKSRGDELVWEMEVELSDFSVFDLHQILDATGDFSEENKLGEGGFGPVYKGQFTDGTEVAVKRLASHSGQGFIEFKNEVQLIAKLQHRNLVRLLGCCSQEEEKILVYEYLPNKSLDFFIFDEGRKALMDWNRRLAIIEGIAEGLLYLHKHSRMRVIHRDLKPSNILLDSEMNPKISDFGLAKIFGLNDTEGSTTTRVVGTYGYMAPEYASEGLFSVKSDVFSFGVLMIEILCGKRNSSTNQYGDFINLLGYAWQLWEEERWIDLIDASLIPQSHPTEITRCVTIALLCVQENAADRPTMLDVVAMLNSETMKLCEPKRPAYFNLRVSHQEASSTTSKSCNFDDMTISITTPR